MTAAYKITNLCLGNIAHITGWPKLPQFWGLRINRETVAAKLEYTGGDR